MPAKKDYKPIATTTDGKLVFMYHPVHGRPVCGSKLPKRQHRPDNTGMFCLDDATMPNGRCRRHGGHALSGPQCPAYIDGKYSKVGNDIGKSYRTMRQNPDLIVLHDDLAMASALAEQMLIRVSEGLSREFLAEVTKAVGYVKTYVDIIALGEGNYEQKHVDLLVKFTNQLISSFTNERDARDTMSEYIEVADLVRRLNETEQKRIERAGAMVRADHLMQVLGEVESLANQTITNLEDRRRFALGLIKRFGPPDGAQATGEHAAALGGGQGNAIHTLQPVR